MKVLVREFLRELFFHFFRNLVSVSQIGVGKRKCGGVCVVWRFVSGILLRFHWSNLKCLRWKFQWAKLDIALRYKSTQPRSKVHHPKAKWRVWHAMQLLIPCCFLKIQSLYGLFCGVSGTSSRCEHPKPGSKTPFPATIVGRRRRGQKSPSTGRRRRNEKSTPRCGAKRPMGCTSSAVGSAAARSSVLRQWRGSASFWAPRICSP